jgi:hypothetical protein
MGHSYGNSSNGFGDFYSCSADVGRINPEEVIIVEPTHACPLIHAKGIQLTHNTMSEQQCLTRHELENKCTKKCKVLKGILAKGKG